MLIAASRSQESILPTSSASHAHVGDGSFVRRSHETGGSENFLADARPWNTAEGTFSCRLPLDQNLSPVL